MNEYLERCTEAYKAYQTNQANQENLALMRYERELAEARAKTVEHVRSILPEPARDLVTLIAPVTGLPSEGHPEHGMILVYLAAGIGVYIFATPTTHSMDYGAKNIWRVPGLLVDDGENLGHYQVRIYPGLNYGEYPCMEFDEVETAIGMAIYRLNVTYPYLQVQAEERTKNYVKPNAAAPINELHHPKTRARLLLEALQNMDGEPQDNLAAIAKTLWVLADYMEAGRLEG